MKIFRVGGYVRDKLLGLQPSDCDYVVVGSSVEEMLKKGFRQIGSFFPVFLHPTSGEEYALARLEKKYGRGHQGFIVEDSRSVTLAEDLKRRDLTINAIAEDSLGNLIDPYHGISDLKAGILRHVSAAFSDDPLRILRVARFAAKLNFRVATATMQLLTNMAKSAEGSSISRERVINELDRALGEKYSQQFFIVLATSNNLAIFFPLLAKCLQTDKLLLKFCHELSCLIANQEQSRWQKYTLLAIYLARSPEALAELTQTKATLKYLQHTQLLHRAMAVNLSDDEILALLKRTDALRSNQQFEKMTTNYQNYLQQHKKLLELQHLADLKLIINALLQPPIARLQQQIQAQLQLPAAILAWQLTTIHQLRNKNDNPTLY